MAYRIDYGQPFSKKFREKQDSRFWISICVFLILFLVSVNIFLPAGREVIREFLIPGDTAVTSAAFHKLVAEVREGESVQSALTAFCREIIWDAQTVD